MLKGLLTCNCGRRSVLHLFVRGKRVGYLCERCGRDDYALRAFLVTAGWLYGWRGLEFSFMNDGAAGSLNEALRAAIGEEASRAAACPVFRKSRQVA